MKNNYAFANIAGSVVWSNAYKQKNKGYTHRYIVSVTEKTNDDKVRKNNFHVVSFNEKNNKIYGKGERIKVNGFLKVNSFKKESDEWMNEVFIQATEIESVEEE